MNDKWPTQDPRNYQREKTGHFNDIRMTLNSSIRCFIFQDNETKTSLFWGQLFWTWNSLVKYSLKVDSLEKLPFTPVLEGVCHHKENKEERGKWVFQEMMKLMWKPMQRKLERSSSLLIKPQEKYVQKDRNSRWLTWIINWKILGIRWRNILPQEKYNKIPRKKMLIYWCEKAESVWTGKGMVVVPS